MQDTPIARQREKLALATVDALRRRGFDAVWVPTAAEMVQRALALLPAGCSVAWGGSQTIRESGLTAAVHAGDYTVIDRDLAATPGERTELHRQGLLADRYLMSANAVAATGELVNIDGTGNRLAALCFGPKEIVMPVSAGKIAPTLEAAVLRARNAAAPANALRLDSATPCTADGLCHNCLAPGCLCNQILITRSCRPVGRIHVILFGEDYGY